MKSLLTISLLLLNSFMFHAQNTIDVSITSFKNDTGKAMIGLYSEIQTFKKRYISLL